MRLNDKLTVDVEGVSRLATVKKIAPGYVVVYVESNHRTVRIER
jgi:hypothetical protein